MRIKAYAKVNWHLAVLGRRPNGYHDLDMVMQRLDLHDDIELEAADELQLIVQGRQLEADSNNLILRAALALRQATGNSQGARMTLTKRIPLGAGLGGGSADAAATLLGLNELWNLGLSGAQLQSIGLGIGADVPYCLEMSPARVGGLGEQIQTLPAFAPMWLVLLQPRASLSTKDVFRHYDAHSVPQAASDTQAVIRALTQGDMTALRQFARNDLQASAASLLPEISTLVKVLYDAGAPFAQMTGSGSVVYGAFLDYQEALAAYEMLRQGEAYCQLCRCL